MPMLEAPGSKESTPTPSEAGEMEPIHPQLLYDGRLPKHLSGYYCGWIGLHSNAMVNIYGEWAWLMGVGSEQWCRQGPGSLWIDGPVQCIGCGADCESGLPALCLCVACVPSPDKLEDVVISLSGPIDRNTRRGLGEALTFAWHVRLPQPPVIPPEVALPWEAQERREELAAVMEQFLKTSGRRVDSIALECQMEGHKVYALLSCWVESYWAYTKDVSMWNDGPPMPCTMLAEWMLQDPICDAIRLLMPSAQEELQQRVDCAVDAWNAGWRVAPLPGYEHDGDGSPPPEQSGVVGFRETRAHLEELGYGRSVARIGALWLTQRDTVPPGASLDPSLYYYWAWGQRWRTGQQLREMRQRFETESRSQRQRLEALEEKWRRDGACRAEDELPPPSAVVSDEELTAQHALAEQLGLVGERHGEPVGVAAAGLDDDLMGGDAPTGADNAGGAGHAPPGTPPPSLPPSPAQSAGSPLSTESLPPPRLFGPPLPPPSPYRADPPPQAAPPAPPAPAPPAAHPTARAAQAARAIASSLFGDYPARQGSAAQAAWWRKHDGPGGGSCSAGPAVRYGSSPAGNASAASPPPPGGPARRPASWQGAAKRSGSSVLFSNNGRGVPGPMRPKAAARVAGVAVVATAQARVEQTLAKAIRWGPPPPADVTPPTELAQRLSELTLHNATAGASRDGTLDSIKTAIDQFDEFMKLTGHAPLRPVSGPGSAEASMYNQHILAQFATWLSIKPSRKTGLPVQPSTVDQYVSMVKSQMSQVAHEPIMVGRSFYLSRTLKGIREAAPPAPPRRARPPLGAALLRDIRQPVPNSPADARRLANELALILVSYCAMLRPEEGAASVDKGISRADVTFYPEGTVAVPMPHAVLLVCPRKKRRWQKVPTIVPYQGGPACAYTALRRLTEVDWVPANQAARTPLFRTAEGGNYTTAQMAEVFRRFAQQLGLGPEYTMYSLRIGGATDRREQGASAEDLRAAGRWDSDIGEVYARPSVWRQTQQTLAAFRAPGASVERAFPGYVQPAWR